MICNYLLKYISFSFNHLVCPEPGCDFVSEERQEIERHMKFKHMTREGSSLKLFFCPHCAENLELSEKDEYEEHLISCGQYQTLSPESIEDVDEMNQPPAPQLSINVIPDHQRTLVNAWVNVKPDTTCGNEKPSLSYFQLIVEALNNSESGMLSLHDIFIYISLRYPFFRMDVRGWKNGIRHTLSVNPKFRRTWGKSTMGRGSMWTMWKTSPPQERAPMSDLADVTVETEDFEDIKCHICEFSVRCDYGRWGAIATTSAARKNAGIRITQHYNNVHHIKNMKICETRGCDFRSDDKLLRMRHKRSHAGHTQCEVCGIQIKEHAIDQHMATHSDLTFDCEYCFRPYAGPGMLK